MKYYLSFLIALTLSCSSSIKPDAQKMENNTLQKEEEVLLQQNSIPTMEKELNPNHPESRNNRWEKNGCHRLTETERLPLYLEKWWLTQIYSGTDSFTSTIHIEKED